jgi:hypothetical protein
MHSDTPGLLKKFMDPHKILRYICRLTQTRKKPRFVVLITGESVAGKEYYANVWCSLLTELSRRMITVRMASIGDATKRDHATAIVPDFGRLIVDARSNIVKR